jgi:DNA invertase Pin-like site-specific DNA recombinase
MAGQYFAKVPFGYSRNQTDRHKLAVDSSTAIIVRRIFDLCLSGYGYEKIAKTLANEEIPTPSEHFGRPRPTAHHAPYDWQYGTIRTILTNPVYLGHTVQGKSTSLDFKNKKPIKLPTEQWVRVDNTHEPIVTQETWDIVQGLIGKRKRSTKKGPPHIFAGLLRCPDCDNTLAKDSRDKFSCWQYKVKGKEHCTNHHITLEQLKTAVLTSIQTISIELRQDKDSFIAKLSSKNASQRQQKAMLTKKERDKTAKRLSEIPGLVKKAFEHNASGKLPDEIYTEMIAAYKTEREGLTAKLEALNATVAEDERESSGIAEFVGLVEKYLDPKELDGAMTHELIEKIVVHQAEKLDGQRSQRIDIFYRYVGIII